MSVGVRVLQKWVGGCARGGDVGRVCVPPNLAKLGSMGCTIPASVERVDGARVCVGMWMGMRVCVCVNEPLPRSPLLSSPPSLLPPMIAVVINHQ